jgi:hypothetical protein
MWAPKVPPAACPGTVPGHSGVAHATWKAEADANSRQAGPRPKQTRNRAAQRAGAEIDPGYTKFWNWLVGGEPWLREPAHPGADSIALRGCVTRLMRHDPFGSRPTPHVGLATTFARLRPMRFPRLCLSWQCPRHLRCPGYF